MAKSSAYGFMATTIRGYTMKFLALLLLLSACSEAPVDNDQGADAGPLGGDDAGQNFVADAGPPPAILGGDRPVSVLYPDDYDASQTWPLIMVLHGYSASGTIQNGYLGVSARGSANGFITLAPDGNRDLGGNRFWNATEACCDFAGSGVDDLGYLTGLIDEAVERLHVDPQRVYLVGHSNGGFMANRIACDAADKVTAVMNIAGAGFLDETRCQPSRSVGYIQVHGTLDNTINYNGGTFQSGVSYPGAETMAERWHGLNSCPDGEPRARPLDLDAAVQGDEANVQSWNDCEGGADVQLWTLTGSGHVPNFTNTFRDELVAELLAYLGR
jgi:polyhydroxybutyrate depolymerase